MPFKKLALAITFSPNSQALLFEAGRLQKLFNAELVLIHVGERHYDLELKLNMLILNAGISLNSTKIIWDSGDPAKVILDKCVEENIDLLIAGALEKETFINYYIGSVARKILRSSPCSILILTTPSTNPKPMKVFCVSAEYSSESENTIKKAYQFALLESADKFILIREFQVPGLAMAVQDSGSPQETENFISQCENEETTKLKMLVKELNLDKLHISTVCLYGKQGWEANRYIRDINGDILVISGPKKELKFLDRVFQHDAEFIFKNLPCSLLLIK